jgi:hypothetical protein
VSAAACVATEVGGDCVAVGWEAPAASLPDDGGPVVAVGVDVPPGLEDVLVEPGGLLVGVVEESAAPPKDVEELVVLL